MPSRSLRRQGLATALLVVSLLALATGSLGSHEGHGCNFEKGCLACRWAADAVAETAAPVPLPHPLAPVAVLADESTAPVALASPEAVLSRGPPLA
jgi:hypothetical protein